MNKSNMNNEPRAGGFNRKVGGGGGESDAPIGVQNTINRGGRIISAGQLNLNQKQKFASAVTIKDGGFDLISDDSDNFLEKTNLSNFNKQDQINSSKLPQNQ